MKAGPCRFCGAQLSITFVDLGMSPLANSYLSESQLIQMERFYPLHVYVCERCLLVQLEEFESPDHIFSDYAYFSSYSDSWLKHAKEYTEMMVRRFGLSARSHVVELASNDGYLLQYFVEQRVVHDFWYGHGCRNQLRRVRRVVNLLEIFERNLAVRRKAVEPRPIGLLGYLGRELPFVLNVINDRNSLLQRSHRELTNRLRDRALSLVRSPDSVVKHDGPAPNRDFGAESIR